jgi:flagellar L-ring protein precursor FlgH
MFNNSLRSRVMSATLLGAMIVCTPSKAWAQATPPPQGQIASGQNTYEELFNKYLDHARNMTAPPSLWMGSLMSDPRAHRLNDLITIRVVETLSATGTADATLSKTGAAQVSLPASPVATAIGKVLPLASATKFAGAGNTTRAGTMTATVTGRVIEVLPNGDMVVEGVREIQVNNDRQVVVLTGVIRPTDVLPGNVVSSASVGQLRIQCLGKGLMKDSLSPGWVIRFLNKIF